jgi:hypothetical protein
VRLEQLHEAATVRVATGRRLFINAATVANVHRLKKNPRGWSASGGSPMRPITGNAREIHSPRRWAKGGWERLVLEYCATQGPAYAMFPASDVTIEAENVREIATSPTRSAWHAMHYASISVAVSESISVSMYVFVYVYVCRSIYLSVYLFIDVYVSTYLSVYLSIYLSLHLSLHLSTCLSIYLSIYLPIYLPIHQSIYSSLSAYLSISITISLSIHFSSLQLLRPLTIQIGITAPSTPTSLSPGGRASSSTGSCTTRS